MSVGNKFNRLKLSSSNEEHSYTLQVDFFGRMTKLWPIWIISLNSTIKEAMNIYDDEHWFWNVVFLKYNFDPPFRARDSTL
jgi:hypothetical protein